MLRRLAEVLLGPLTVRRRLPANVGGGVVVANPKMAGLRYLLRSAENLDPILFRVVQSMVKPNDTVWDIGANVGLFAAAAAGLAGREGKIYAIEADLDAFRLLQRTAGSQPVGHASIKCLNVAISSESGVVEFNIAKRSRSTNFISGYGSTQTGGVVETRLVPALALDVLLAVFPAPSMLKIDVEGAELMVLQGAHQILSRVRPVLFIEVGSETANPVAALLRENDYRLLDGQSLQSIGPSDSAPWDTVAIPSEKFASYVGQHDGA